MEGELDHHREQDRDGLSVLLRRPVSPLPDRVHGSLLEAVRAIGHEDESVVDSRAGAEARAGLLRM